jgi:hypothetical protein
MYLSEVLFLCNYTTRSSHNDPQSPTSWNPNHHRPCIGRVGTIDRLVCLSTCSATPARPRRRLRHRNGWPRASARTPPCADAPWPHWHELACVSVCRGWPPVYAVGRRVPWSLPTRAHICRFSEWRNVSKNKMLTLKMLQHFAKYWRKRLKMLEVGWLENKKHTFRWALVGWKCILLSFM